MKFAPSIAAIYTHQPGKPLPRPLLLNGVPAGFPSPAEDYIDQHLDLNELLITHPAATFFIRAAGDSMHNAGINHNDILVVDRALTAGHGKIVIAILDGELTVKRLHKTATTCRLEAENPAYPALTMQEGATCEIWGVVTAVIKQL